MKPAELSFSTQTSARRNNEVCIVDGKGTVLQESFQAVFERLVEVQRRAGQPFEADGAVAARSAFYFDFVLHGIESYLCLGEFTKVFKLDDISAKFRHLEDAA